MTSIISVSMPTDMAIFIKKEGISPSFVLQEAIRNIEAVKNGQLLDSNASLQAKVTRLGDTIEKMAQFINDKGFYDEFLAKKE